MPPSTKRDLLSSARVALCVLVPTGDAAKRKDLIRKMAMGSVPIPSKATNLASAFLLGRDDGHSAHARQLSAAESPNA
jgi:hypothetical protein